MFVEDIVWADNDTREQAEANCGGDIVCLFDAASTNDVSIGLNSQAVKVKVVEENKQLSKSKIYSGTSIQGTPSGPKHVSLE